MNTWVLLRGLTREAGHWGRFPTTLCHEFPQARAIALDLPGNGEFNAKTSPMNIFDMVAHCRTELAKRNVPPPYRLLALSMGGMVATSWAEHFPADIDVCVLINTSFAASSPLHARLRARAWPALLQFLFTRNTRDYELRVFNLTSRLSKAAPTLIEEWITIRQSRPVSRQNALRQLIAAARFHAPLSAPVSTLVLASAADGVVDARCSQAIARRWNCAIAVHPTAGHDLPLDAGEWVTREIRAWLATVSVRS